MAGVNVAANIGWSKICADDEARLALRVGGFTPYPVLSAIGIGRRISCRVMEAAE